MAVLQFKDANGNIVDVGLPQDAVTPEEIGAIAEPETAEDGQVLTYNGTSWEAENPSSAGQTYTGTLLADGWAADSAGYQVQTITIPGIKANYSINPVADVVLSGTDLEADQELKQAFGLLLVIGTVADGIVAKCGDTAPEINIPISINVWG